jgi:hypothetical protein
VSNEKITIEEIKKRDFFKIIQSKDEMRDWIFSYLEIDLPFEHVDQDSTSDALSGLYEIYEAVRDNKGKDCPGYIMLSCRSGYKTLSSSILEVLLMFHFRITIAHMAAIKGQSAKAIEYVNGFVRKTELYWKHYKWKKLSDNKGKVEFAAPDANDPEITSHTPYIIIVVATMQGANAQHTNMLFIDEVDVMNNPKAYEEAQKVPDYDANRGMYPITVFLSTRKYAFGLMQKEIENAAIKGNKILRWNLIDLAGQCEPERHRKLSDGKTILRYIKKTLPLKQLSPEEYESIEPRQKIDWEAVQAHPGCTACPLLPVCKTKLASKPDSAVGGLYKPIQYIINEFRRTETDMAEAQLLCWKPSSAGLVYPRFEHSLGGNLIGVAEAYEALMGEVKPDVTFDQLIAAMRQLGIQFYAGLDWGYTKEFTIVVVAKMPNGDFWLVDNYASPGLELSDQVEKGIHYQEKYNISKWFVDQAYPGSIKTWTRLVGPCPKFTKDVMGGIEATRGVIVTASGRRMLKVIEVPHNKRLKDVFKLHSFILDNTGEPTDNPDDGIMSDTADSTRYIFQNLIGTKKNKPIITTAEGLAEPSLRSNSGEKVMDKQTGMVLENMAANPANNSKTGGRKGFNWSF